MKYNAILLEKYEPRRIKNGLIQYRGRFLIAVRDGADAIEIIASQLEPIYVEPWEEFILDVYTKECGPNTYYNIRPKSSYVLEPFPVIKHEEIYWTTLDGDGYDAKSRKYYSEYPYTRVCIHETKYYKHGELVRAEYELQAVEHIDHTLVRNESPNLTPTKDMSAVDQKRLIEALRDYLPIEEHPNKRAYSTSEIFKQYREIPGVQYFENNIFQYGSDDTHCICGHEIKEICYCEYMSNKGPDGISKMPLGAIGNCCIKKMAWESKLYARLLMDIHNNFVDGIFLTERDVSKKNGFGDIQMEFLRQCVLTPSEFNNLQDILNSRYTDDLRPDMKAILYHISKFYEANRNKIFNQNISC